jgi:pentapeptide MXKDX repeat protein
MVRRIAMLALSLSLTLGLMGAHHLLAQDEKKTEAKKDDVQKDAVKKDDAKKEEAKKDDAKKIEAKKDDATKEAPKKDESKKEEPKKEEPLPPIPPEVEAKLEAARRAVAEAIVAAQDAGLVKTSINPPPILDILITGRAIDESTLKARTGVSPEVFGAWFTGYGQTANVTPQTDVRIIRPEGGLKLFYDQRAAMLNKEIEAVRKAKGTPAPAAKKEETKKEELKKEEVKKEEAKKEAPK